MFLTFVVVPILLIWGVKGHTKTFTLKVSNFMPPQHIMSKMLEEWGKEIEKRTSGVVKINVFSGGTLTPPQQIFDGVIAGISDAGLSVFAYTPGRFPVMEGFEWPSGYTKALQGSKAVNDFFKTFKPKELTDVHVCYLFVGGPSMIHTKSPVQSLGDLKGKRIRATGNSQRLIKALGAVPVALTQGDVYDALGKGLIEGNLVAVEALYTFKQYEVCKYTTLHTRTYWPTAFYVVMNLKTWNSFPEDTKTIITALNEEWAVKTGKTWDDDDSRAIKQLEKVGHKFISLSNDEQTRWADAAQIVKQQYVEYANSKGLEGAKIVESAKRLVDKYQTE